MWTWIRAHDRALWWAVLIAAIAIGTIRQPRCAADATPWWVYAWTGVFMLGLSAVTLWTLLPLRRARRARRTPQSPEIEDRHGDEPY